MHACATLLPCSYSAQGMKAPGPLWSASAGSRRMSGRVGITSMLYSDRILLVGILIGPGQRHLLDPEPSQSHAPRQCMCWRGFADRYDVHARSLTTPEDIWMADAAVSTGLHGGVLGWDAARFGHPRPLIQEVRLDLRSIAHGSRLAPHPSRRRAGSRPPGCSPGA
jgi:hypothetical protein